MILEQMLFERLIFAAYRCIGVLGKESLKKNKVEKLVQNTVPIYLRLLPLN